MVFRLLFYYILESVASQLSKSYTKINQQLLLQPMLTYSFLSTSNVILPNLVYSPIKCSFLLYLPLVAKHPRHVTPTGYLGESFFSHLPATPFPP